VYHNLSIFIITQPPLQSALPTSHWLDSLNITTLHISKAQQWKNLIRTVSGQDIIIIIIIIITITITITINTILIVDLDSINS